MFIKHATNKMDKPVRLLYLMGATWHNVCMFDLKTTESNFSSILNDNGIETYTFDIFGSGPNDKPDPIPDLHNQNISYALDLIEQYNISFVLAYSYGCIVANEIAKRTKLKGLILLDPSATLKSNKDFIGDGKAAMSKQSIRQALIDNGTNIKPNIIKDHLAQVCKGDVLVTAVYPGKTNREQTESFLSNTNVTELFKQCPVRVCLTKNVSEAVAVAFPKESIVQYPESSHWILLEDGRYRLAKDIVEFINETKIN